MYSFLVLFFIGTLISGILKQISLIDSVEVSAVETSVELNL